MRILFLSNFYPPARPGGYTQWCQEVADGLRARGHHIGVLTSRHEAHKASGEPNMQEQHDVFRLLHLDGDLLHYRPLHFFLRWWRQRRENIRTVRHIVNAFQPDLIFIWGMWAMSHSVPAVAERLMPARTVYFLSDYWPAAQSMHTAYWRRPGRHWYTRLPRKLLQTIALRMLAAEEQDKPAFRHTICVSAAVRDILIGNGVPLQDARVIHGGTRLNGFSRIPERDFSAQPLKALYAGQLVEHKGVHTALEAMDRLNDGNHTSSHFTLDVVGAGSPQYEASLRDFVKQHDLGDCVSFHGQVPKTDIPVVLRDADVLVFPSIYEEPFARTLQEAMLAGLVVVGTTTGGTPEILRENHNGLTFPPQDAERLAAQLCRLSQDPALCARLAHAGRCTVLESYTLEHMTDRIEDYLLETVEREDRETPSSSPL